jgi:hypothetical protein
MGGCKNATVSLNVMLQTNDLIGAEEMAAAKRALRREWTKEDVRTLKTLAREGKKTTVIARKLKRTVGATYQQASKRGVALGAR